MRKRKYTDQQFTDAISKNYSIREVLKILGVAPTGGSYKLFHARVKNLNIDTSHFTGQGHLKGKKHNWNNRIPLSEILIKDSAYTTSSHLKSRLVKELVLDYKCNICGINNWFNKELSLHIDHINGINTDNRIENLRLLCPNCHSQTDTYCSKNNKKFVVPEGLEPPHHC